VQPVRTGEQAFAPASDTRTLGLLPAALTTGPLRVVRAALPHLTVCGHGRVINLDSLAGKRVGSNVGYAMTKFAVVAMTHGIRREGRAAGIRATVVCPGYVATRYDAERR
jgi:NAD(P)-dependent dehydrogenase (short-subunit alcohol dehydrogenase family)